MNERVKPNGDVWCRVRIEGTYQGRPWVYEDDGGNFSQCIHPDGNPSAYWWAEGGFSCDCNRWDFLPSDMWPDDSEECGDTILIDRITPLSPHLPTLVLDETAHGKRETADVWPSTDDPYPYPQPPVHPDYLRDLPTILGRPYFVAGDDRI